MGLKDICQVGQYFYEDVNGVWTVREEDIKDGSKFWFNCKTKCEAKILARLIRIEIAIRNMSKCTTA